MNIGKRKFLQFAGMAAASAAIDPLSAIIRSGKYFVDQRLGFGFVIPEHWDIEAFASFDTLKNQQILNELEGVSPADLLADLSEGLVAVIRKYPDEAVRKFSPGITFSMSGDEELAHYENFTDFVSDAIKGYSLVLKDYTVIAPVKISTGRNFQAYSFKARYMFEHQQIEPTLIDNEVLVIHHDKILYTIHLYDSPYTNENCSAELMSFKNSLHLA